MPRTPPPTAFTPVPVRSRVDGWTVERQTGFVEALAATANVQAAATAVGMSAAAAYALRARPEAASFREAWNLALDYAVHRLGEAALDRALNGSATPIFFQGEQVGERRRYDERLTMFLLRLRDPQRHGGWREAATPHHHPDVAAMLLHVALARTTIDGLAADDGLPERKRPPLPTPRLLSPREVEALEVALAQMKVDADDEAEEARRSAEREAYYDEIDREEAAAAAAAAAPPSAPPPAPPSAPPPAPPPAPGGTATADDGLGDWDDDDDDIYIDDDVYGEAAGAPPGPTRGS